MPTIEQVDFEVVTFLERMEQYLNRLSSMSKEDAETYARLNLRESGIIGEDGQLTGFYKAQ